MGEAKSKLFKCLNCERAVSTPYYYSQLVTCPHCEFVFSTSPDKEVKNEQYTADSFELDEKEEVEEEVTEEYRLIQRAKSIVFHYKYYKKHKNALVELKSTQQKYVTNSTRGTLMFGSSKDERIELSKEELDTVFKSLIAYHEDMTNALYNGIYNTIKATEQ